jgi:uncharacterized protein (DUF433 family)
MSLVIEEQEIDSLPITIDPDVVSGAPVFRGTRVPVDALLSNLEAGLSLDEFLENFPLFPASKHSRCWFCPAQLCRGWLSPDEDSFGRMRASTAEAIALPEFEISTVQDMGWTGVTMEHWLLWRKVNSTYSLRRIRTSAISRISPEDDWRLSSYPPIRSLLSPR